MDPKEKFYKTCCFTGHRSEKFPWGDDRKNPSFDKMQSWLYIASRQAYERGVKRFICGNATGVDTWAAEMVIELRQLYPDIMLEIAVPYDGHNDNIAEVMEVQKKADIVHVVSIEKSILRAYEERNRYMVDHSDILIAVYDDSSGLKGGTWQTLSYARKMGLDIIQLQWKGIIDGR